MVRLQLESATDLLNLDDVLELGRGVQVLSGVTGLGLPPKQVQWLEGAGDGAIARGRRTLPRDIDLPLMVQAENRTELKSWLSRLAKMLATSATLKLFEEDGTSWDTRVEHVGGGGYTYGVDTVGENDFFTVVTLRAGDPYFTSSVPQSVQIKSQSSGAGFLGSGLAQMSVANGQAIGVITLNNPGDANAYPVWTIKGPGSNFKAISPNGEKLQWAGTLAATDTLTIDTKKGTVVDQTGANRYASLVAAPRFWSIPPGNTSSTASLDNVVVNQSSILCTWRPRKWMVI